MPSRTSRFQSLVEQAAACRLCPNLADQPAVLSSGNGSLNAQVVFVAEAPGRFGAGRTGIPFSGDQSGKNFETLLDHTGWGPATTAAPPPKKYEIVLPIWNLLWKSSNLKSSSPSELSVLKLSITSWGPNTSSQKSSPAR